MKNLADSPVHLQRMLLRLQDYDFTIKYRPGGEMVVAETEKKQDYHLTIKDDPLLSALADMIITVWPDDINGVPKAL